jgi:hypothetical protein
MIVTPFDDRSPSRSFLTAWPDSLGGRPPSDDRKERATAQLLERGVLTVLCPTPWESLQGNILPHHRRAPASDPAW